MQIRLPNNWKPRPYQLPLWHYLESGGVDAWEIAHRRWGKDDVALHWTATAAHKRTGVYWHMLPEASQARKAIWEAINPHSGKRRIDEAFPREIRDTTRENEMFIRFKCGSTWQVVGSDNYDSLVGSPPIGIVASEWALAKPHARAYLRPILKENGGWWLTITTPRGKNHCHRSVEALRDNPDAFVHVSPATDTGMFSKEDLEQERQAYIAEYGISMGEALYEQEYLCSFDAAIVGSIFGKDIKQAETNGRITRVQHDAKKLTYASFDLGEGDATSIWFYQIDGPEFNYIDYYECTREKTAHYLQLLNSKGYNYAQIYLPHDADHKRMNADKTIAGQFRANGFPVTVIPNTPKKIQIAAGSNRIAASRFDKEKCAVGLEGLRNYRWNYNKSLDELTSTPVHDWASHPSDAFMCGALGEQREVKALEPLNYTAQGIV